MKFFHFVLKNKNSFKDIYTDNFCKDDFEGVTVIYFNEIDIIYKTKKNKLSRKAAEIGSNNLLMITLEHNYSWDKYTFENAVSNGHLHCLKYLHEHGYLWDINTCCATWHGHLDCLKYLHENGIPWNIDTCK